MAKASALSITITNTQKKTTPTPMVLATGAGWRSAKGIPIPPRPPSAAPIPRPPCIGDMPPDRDLSIRLAPKRSHGRQFQYPDYLLGSESAFIIKSARGCPAAAMSAVSGMPDHQPHGKARRIDRAQRPVRRKSPFPFVNAFVT